MKTIKLEDGKTTPFNDWFLRETRRLLIKRQVVSTETERREINARARELRAINKTMNAHKLLEYATAEEQNK